MQELDEVGDADGRTAPVLQKCDVCTCMGTLVEVQGEALPGGKAGVCEKCVKRIAVGHPDRVPSHVKFHRYVKFLVVRLSGERQRSCAFPDCKVSLAKGALPACVACSKHEAAMTEALFMVSEGNFVTFNEEGALALLQQVAAECKQDEPGAGASAAATKSDDPKPTPFSGVRFTCSLCKVSDASVGGYEMTFADGTPAPAKGEQVVCGECRGKVSDYIRNQPALRDNFAARGLSEKEQWSTILGFALDTVLRVPGCRAMPGFGVADVAPRFARCKDPRCKCAASFNGMADQHCCITCHNGTPCETNCHRQPFQWPPAAPTGRTGLGSPSAMPRSLADSLLNQMRTGDHAQRAELAKAMRPRFGETAAEMEDRLRRATAPPADAQARRRVMAQSSLWTRLDKEREDALALPEGMERDMAVRVASEKRLKTEMFMWKRLDPDQVTAPSVVSDLKGKPARARAMRERTVYQFGVLLCRRLLEDAQSSLSTRMNTYVKGAMKRFRYSAARLDTSFLTKQFTIEDHERKEATGLSETYFASRSSLLMSAEKIDREFHKVREAALYGKKLATGNGYQVGSAAKPAKVTPKVRAQEHGGYEQALETGRQAGQQARQIAAERRQASG